MNLTMQVKLLPSEAQAAAILRTIEQFNAACTAIAVVAFERRCINKAELQKIVYANVRRNFGLPSELTLRAFAKVTEIYKRDKAVQPTFQPHGAIVYDQRTLSWKGLDRISVVTLGGREVMPWVAGDYQQARPERTRGQADLIYRNGAFYLLVVVNVGDVPPGDPQGLLDIDLGNL